MSADSFSRIAFVELWRLGDSVLATAGLRALREARPKAEIALVSNPAYSDPLLRSNDYDVHIPFAPFWTRGMTALDKYLPWTIDYREVFRAWHRLRAFRADTYLLFRGDPREQLFFRSLAHGEIVDARRRFPILPGTRLVSIQPGLHRSREYVAQIQAWSGENVGQTPEIRNVAAQERSDSYVLFHPGAGWVFRHWQPAKLARLADELVERLTPQETTVTITGGPTERDLIAETINLMHHAASVDIAFPSLEELYSLTAGARAVVCNNTSIVHIAQAMNIPCVVMIGPSDPVRWGVFRPNSRNVCQSVGLPCHPCAEHRCVRPNHPCIDEITVEDVLSALQTMGILAG